MILVQDNCVLKMLRADSAVIYCKYEQLRLCTKVLTLMVQFCAECQYLIAIASKDLDLRRGKA